MITRDDIRQYLGDREWHTGVELLEHFSGVMRPEQASQAYFASRKKSTINQIPLDAAVRKGAELVISPIVSTLSHAGLIETMGGKTMIEKEIRWTAWYCWLCGYQVKTAMRWPTAACVRPARTPSIQRSRSCKKRRRMKTFLLASNSSSRN